MNRTFCTISSLLFMICEKKKKGGTIVVRATVQYGTAVCQSYSLCEAVLAQGRPPTTRLHAQPVTCSQSALAYPCMVRLTTSILNSFITVMLLSNTNRGREQVPSVSVCEHDPPSGCCHRGHVPHFLPTLSPGSCVWLPILKYSLLAFFQPSCSVRRAHSSRVGTQRINSVTCWSRRSTPGWSVMNDFVGI